MSRAGDTGRLSVGRNRTILALEPHMGYPIRRMAIEKGEEDLILTADGRVLERFSPDDLGLAVEAFRSIDPGKGSVFEIGLLADVE